MMTEQRLTIANGQLLQAKQAPSLFYNERPINEAIFLLVIHNISLPPNQYGGPYVEQLFTGELSPEDHNYFEQIYQLEVSSHLFIRRDGELVQFVNFNDRAWHAGKSNYQGRDNCNNFSIGIELEGSDTDIFTLAQYRQLTDVTRCLQIHYPITDIVAHSDIAPGRKSDPGPCFNWQYYRQLLTIEY